jgi:N6-adenosine-specific RNA methylase IME4
MTLKAIKALDIPSIAAPDCVLALWATSPMILFAFETMAAWGFEYRSQAIWVKDKIGLGFWFRGKHEHLLIGTRGHPPAPAPGMNFPSVFEAKVREHSRKPDEAYGILESYFPTVPRIELFARFDARPGWNYWGPEAPLLQAETVGWAAE